MNAPQPNDKNHRPLRTLILVHAVGIDFAICIAAGFFLGDYLRSRFGGVFWILAGLAVGMAAGVWSAVLLIKKFIGARKDG